MVIFSIGKVLPKECLIYMPKDFKRMRKETGASIIPVLVMEAVDTLAASLPGSG